MQNEEGRVVDAFDLSYSDNISEDGDIDPISEQIDIARSLEIDLNAKIHFYNELKKRLLFICLSAFFLGTFLGSVYLTRKLNISPFGPYLLSIVFLLLSLFTLLWERWRVRNVIRLLPDAHFKLSRLKFFIKLNERIVLIIIAGLFIFVYFSGLGFFSMIALPLAEITFTNIFGCWRKKQRTESKLFSRIVSLSKLV